MKWTFFFAVLWVGPMVLAHNPNEGYFEIHEQDLYVEITAELPWSMRYALVESFPLLETSKSRDDFDAALFDYLADRIQLFDAKGQAMKLESVVEQIDEQRHSHQNSFTLRYLKTNPLKQVVNSVMTEIYDTQKNIHLVEIQGETVRVTTSKSQPSFDVPSTY